MRVLVDTSIWIEYARSRPSLSSVSLSFLDLLLEDDRAVTIYPIQTEILSGNLSPHHYEDTRSSLEALHHVDCDWNHSEVWDELSKLAHRARKNGLPIPGLVDPMILLAAKKSDVSLWTLDQALLKLATVVQVHLF